ncbi:hypothetical protein M3Y98_00186300 [Aphelenchoides besseyi]|nr:hypothetical protein M3Y98_00186300 [Aphelenchoides besseyi]KAI6200168.1 hypothetical protein M3Y96_00704400 [Aphelenchoides besseyi]
MSDAAGAKLRSQSQEAALDAKIKEIQTRNREIEERQKIVQKEAKEVKTIKGKTESTASKSEEKQPNEQNGNSKALPTEIKSTVKSGRTEKRSKPPTQSNVNSEAVNGREWDVGKKPIDQWKMNVPEIGDQQRTRRNAPSYRGRGRGRGNFPRPSNDGRPGFFHDDRQKEELSTDGAKPSDSALTVEGKEVTVKRGDRRNQRNPTIRGATRSTANKTEQTPKNDRPQRPNQNVDENRRPKAATSRGQLRRRANDRIGSRENKTEEPKVHDAKDEAKRPRPLRNRNEQRKSDVPDDIQVRQIVRTMIGRVCAEEEREKQGMPKEKESEV